MKIAYNPKTGAALTTAPANNDITFDLSGLNIFVRGEKFKGTDTTYSVFKKHTSSSGGGYNGLVPVPSYSTENIRFLREDGTWSIPSAEASIYTLLTNQDLDNYLGEGKWYWAPGSNSVINKPDGVDAFELYVGRCARNYRYLKLITYDGIIWFRYYNASSWTPWVRWYTDANTDYRVKQSTTTTTNFRPLILGYNNSTDKSVLANNITNLVYTTTTIYAQPSSGTLHANKFIGKIDWSNIDGKPSSFTPATHYHSYLKGWSDTRTVATTPNDYNGYFKVVGIKTAGATLGLTSTQAGSYATMIGWRGWSDSSGGYAWEIASTDKNRLYVRSGSETTWNNGWSAIAYTTDTYPTSQINKLTGYKIATSVAALATTDTLNTALGKIEYKLNIAYDLVTKANDSDGTIENLKEILDVLSGISDTETIKGIVGKYLPLTGGTMIGPIVLTSGSNSAMDKTALSLISKSGTELVRIGTNNIGSLGLYAIDKIYIRPNIPSFSGTLTLGIVLSNTEFTYNTYPVLHSNNYVNYITPSYILEKLKTVDGAGSKLDADTIDNYHASSFESYHKVTIDTTGLDSDTWYPVTMSIGKAQQTRIRIEGVTSTTGTWNTRSDKFMAVELDYTTQGSGWGFISPFRTVFLFNLGAGAAGSNCVAGIGLLTNSSTEYVYVRGGAKYNFYVSRYITPKLRTTTYTASSQSISPTTTSPTAISRTNALISDIPAVTNYYWANIKVSSSSSTTTTPIFATATATTSITTPLVTSSNVLTLNGVSGVYLKYNSSDKAAIVLSSTYFKPFDSANNKLSLGTSSARWSNVYSVLGNFSGLITATSGVLIGGTTDIGWYLNSTSRICAGISIARGVNVGSLLVSNAWADASKVPTNGIYSKGNVSSAGFVKASSSDSYVLLGGGGHKALSDFMLKSEELTTNLTTISKSLTVTQAWMDTGITSTNLPANGTYIVLIQVNANDSTGNMYSCYSSGVMSWYKDSTNDTETDEIILHRSGHAYGKIIYLRTVMQSSGVLKLLIGASSNIGLAYTYTFKFKRII